jgi:hypothetical protein
MYPGTVPGHEYPGTRVSSDPDRSRSIQIDRCQGHMESTALHVDMHIPGTWFRDSFIFDEMPCRVHGDADQGTTACKMHPAIPGYPGTRYPGRLPNGGVMIRLWVPGYWAPGYPGMTHHTGPNGRKRRVSHPWV